MTPRPKVYLSGPMRGRAECNFPLFLEAHDYLEAQGYDVADPAQHDLSIGFKPDPHGLCSDEELAGAHFDLGQSILWDLGEILTAQGIVLLPDWHTSPGARLELELARFLRLPQGRYHARRLNRLTWDHRGAP